MSILMEYMPQGLPHSDELSAQMELSDASISSASPTQSEFPELTPYSTASSFSLPQHCDPSLLTPCSSLSSPPIQCKIEEDFSTSFTNRQLSQQPSPPPSAGMYPAWTTQYDMMGQCSQAPSPMVNHHPIPAEFYITSDRRSPIPPEPYMGAFAVSAANLPDPIQSNASPFYSMGHMNTQYNQPESQGEPMFQVDSSLLPVPSPLPSQERRQSSATDHLPKNATEKVRSLPGSPHHSTHGVKKNRKSKAGTGTPKSKCGSEDANDEHTNCHGQEVPPTLKENCPDEVRCIFESRWRHRYKRGQDMWDSIQNDFLEEFEKANGKEVLQMKFKRGRSKYIQWESKDLDILHEAWVATEKDRYKTMLDKFIEFGGSKNMLLSPTDIEYMAVTELKLEDDILVDKMGEIDVRRRFRVPKKATMGRVPVSKSELPVNGDMVLNQILQRRNWEDESSDASDISEQTTERSVKKSIPKLPHPSATTKTLYHRRRR